MNDELLYQCFMHFYGLDISNAAMHMAPVRYSPITFRLAEAIRALPAFQEYEAPEEVRSVLLDIGEYEEDKGR